MELNLTKRQIDSVKGILMIAIVIGHSPLQYTIPYLKNVVYTFHVYCFLFLPFLYYNKKNRKNFILNRTIRYLVPYAIFLLFYGILYFLVYLQPEQITSWLKNLIIGLIVGTAFTLKEACGLQILWFLPVLYVVNLMINAYFNMETWKRRTTMTVMVLLHPFINAMPEIAKNYILFGIHIMVFIFPLGVISRIIWSRFNKDARYGIIAFIGMITGIILTIYFNSAVRIGVIGVYGFENIGLMLLHDVIPILSFFAFLKISRIIEKIDLLVIIGKHSLTIFLTHQIIIHTIYMASENIYSGEIEIFHRLILDIMIIAIAISISIILSKIIYSYENIRRIIFPRYLVDWKMS